MKLNKSIINFGWLFISSIAIKGLGVLRESIIAYMIGNTIEFATFNTLRSIVDFFLAFVIGVPVMESILVPKYAGLYLQNKTINFQPIWNQTLLFSKYLFLLSVILLFFVSYLKTDIYDLDLVIWVLLFSSYLAINLSNSVLFSLQKTIGNFQKYSTQSFLNAVFTLIIIFLSIGQLGLKSILVASIFGILFSNFLLKRGLNSNFNKTEKSRVEHLIKLKDINFHRLISVNHAIFIGFTGRLLISFENDYQINYYQYSFIIISSFMLMIVSNIASIILYRSSVSDSSSLKKTILLTFLIAVLANTALYFFGNYIISILYERGQFNDRDTQSVFEFLKIFLIPYTFFSITQVMIQPFLKVHSENNMLLGNVVKRTGQIIFITIAISLMVGFSLSNYKIAVQVLLYTSSLSIFVYLSKNLKKLNTENFNKHTIR
ncbi:Peptidoglycan biosynthesis protein MviN/MurJ, putative lipid II flippase [Dyadobacter koreensis]|uniref:Peptidoglycan biosynthesis protein MviN/MurJ, putative lipid II flippase n=1 Tax=Dyadobacter koreensis TaxID=408657 RepID=A0A1H6RC84_9BACT|nr:hypothetical protein [Dyadobacter koreensis]SEI52096.1 Peptidoglycan biosynthesis protein MviN/MurJ, putative lipid II flippase [Dyadobacter koreensis]